MSEENDSGKNQFDRSVHDQTTRKVEALPDLIDLPPEDQELPAGLEEETRPSEEDGTPEPVKQTAKRQPHWTPVPEHARGAGKKHVDEAAEAPARAEAPRKPAPNQDPYEPARAEATPVEGEETPPPAAADGAPEGSPKSKEDEFAIELDDDFFDDLFEAD